LAQKAGLAVVGRHVCLRFGWIVLIEGRAGRIVPDKNQRYCLQIRGWRPAPVAATLLQQGMSKKPPKPRRDNPAQSEQFVKAARELGVDEDDAAFVEKLKKIAKVKPPKTSGRK